MKRIFAVLSLVAFSLGLPAATATKSHAPAHTEGRFSDAEIEATIKTKLAKSKIGKDGMQVHVKGGVATWTGNTNVMQHKGAATRMARTAGATQVVNNIKISDQAANPLRRVQVKTN
jgi:osmotically-inducible protein OsmY